MLILLRAFKTLHTYHRLRAMTKQLSVSRYLKPGDPLAYGGISTVAKYSIPKLNGKEAERYLSEIDGYVSIKV